jgi:hypothetical protein
VRRSLVHRSTRWSGALALVAGIGALLVTAPADARPDGGNAAVARAGSIVYVKGGKLWVASADGRVKRRVRHAGRFENPSQADNGTVVAQRGISLYRMNRRGRLLNKPITTAFRTNSILPAFHGPLWPEVSPDARKIAYTYSFTAAHYDPACNCNRVSPSLNTAYTYADRFVERPETTFGLARFYAKASWIDNRQVLGTTQHLFDYAGNVLNSVVVDPLGGGQDSYRTWFSACMAGCDDLLTLQMHRLDEGEMTRQKDKLVFVSGPLNGAADGSQLQIHRLAGLPPAIPPGFCQISGPNGKFSSPTWSPDGRSLAWADARGIWVAEVGDISGATCQLTPRLVIRGGTQPDWGPARP